MKSFAITMGLLASLLCLLAGILVLLSSAGDGLNLGIGTYFIAKAFFVGPLLFVTVNKMSSS